MLVPEVVRRLCFLQRLFDRFFEPNFLVCLYSIPHWLRLGIDRICFLFVFVHVVDAVGSRIGFLFCFDDFGL